MAARKKKNQKRRVAAERMTRADYVDRIDAMAEEIVRIRAHYKTELGKAEERALIARSAGEEAGEERAYEAVTHALARIVDVKHWNGYDSDGGLNEAAGYEVRAILIAAGAMSDWNDHVARLPMMTCASCAKTHRCTFDENGIRICGNCGCEITLGVNGTIA